MPPLRKRTRRLLVIASLAVGGLAAAGGAYLYRQAQLDRKALDARQAGHAALAGGRPQEALDALLSYLRRFGEAGAAAEDYLAFARARQAVELPENRHMVGSIGPLRRALELDPDCAPAKEALLAAYVATDYQSEALDLVEVMLEGTPHDAKLLRIRADALESLRRFQPALAAAQEITVADPGSIDGYFRVLRLMGRTGASGREVETWVETVSRQHPDDARFELLRAAMFAQRRDDAAARASLDRALAAPAAAADPEYALLLVGSLDLAGRFQDSLAVLERAASVADHRVRRELLRRLWFAGRAAEVRRTASAWSRDELAADAEVAALVLLSPDDGGPSPDAERLREALGRRVDAAGRAWNALVAYVAVRGAGPRPESVTALADAVRAVPGSALLRQALGDAYASLGEADLALASWSASADRAPAWSRPLLQKARALLASGRSHQAFSAARGAVARSPGDVEAISVYLDTIANVVGKLDARTLESLRRALETVIREDPANAGDAVPVYVEMLCRTDREAAERHMREVLSGGTALSESALLRLSEAADGAGIPLRDHFLDLAESIHGCTPAVGLARARSRARSTDPEAGLASLEASRVRSKTGERIEWDLVRATYLESVGSEDAGAAWIGISEAHPDDLRAQLGALASAAAWKRRESVSRVIDRVERLTGSEAVTARIARARWLLDSPDASDADVARAAGILNDVTRAVPSSVSARVLLARALERLGNPEQAEEQLRIAGEHAPENTWIMLELARIAQVRQRPDAARRQMERLLRSDNLEPEQIEKAAYLLALQGDYRQGRGLLETLTAQSQMRREGMLLLAQLHARLGEPERALELCERLLESPDVASVELAAAIRASTGRTEAAEATLARLDSLAVPASTRALVRARHAATWGPPGAARRWFRAAVEAAPREEEPWIAALGHAVASGDAEWFRTSLDDARTADIDAFRFVREERATFEAALADPRLRPVILTALDAPERREVLVEVLRVVNDGWAERDRREETARRARSIAEANPRVLALQLLSADLCASTGDLASACELADRSRAEFPNSSAAARQSAELHASLGRWPEALERGISWSDRAVHDDVAAAVFVTEMFLRCGRPADAVARIEPLVAAARARPETDAPILLSYAISLARGGRSAPLAALLGDLASRSPRWRSLPFETDARRLGDPSTAALWLTAASAAAPDPEPAERLARARGWASAAETYGGEALDRGAADAIRDLRASGPSAEAERIAAALAQRAGELEAATAGYRKALDLDPTSVLALNNLAMVLADLGHWEDAVTEARRALKLRHDVAELHDTLAYALTRGGRHADAVIALKRACDLDPKSARFWIARAEGLAASGDRRSATESLRRAEGLLALQRDAPEPLRQRAQALREGLE